MNDFDAIMERMLSMIPDNLDKRQGSVIYNALAPCAMELSEAYTNLDIQLDQTYLMTAIYENLDRRAADYGLIRIQPISARRAGLFYDEEENIISIDEGNRFFVPDDDITYIYNETLPDGTAVLTCEQPGTIGNAYFGEIIPLQDINNLERAELSAIVEAGVDIEDDDMFRDRILKKLRLVPFGGNVDGYHQFITDIPGIGQCKIFPVWDGGGTVKVFIVEDEYNPVSQTIIDNVKNIVDPVTFTGSGFGIAPIGHSVTIDTPSLYNVSIYAKLVLSNRTLGQVQSEVEGEIWAYIESVKRNWGEINDNRNYMILSVQISDIIVASKRVFGVVDVSNVTINGSTSNLIIPDDTFNTQYIPNIPVGGIILSD